MLLDTIQQVDTKLNMQKPHFYCFICQETIHKRKRKKKKNMVPLSLLSRLFLLSVFVNDAQWWLARLPL